VAINTEKIIPFIVASQRVIGGNKQKMSIHILSPGMLTECESWRIAQEPKIEIGPKMYIPASTHPHLGRCFLLIQLAIPSKVTPARGTAFDAHRFTS
jgi:hypothetical protein